MVTFFDPSFVSLQGRAVSVNCIHWCILLYAWLRINVIIFSVIFNFRIIGVAL